MGGLKAGTLWGCAMAAPKFKPMTEAEYEVWHRLQDDRYEYVDGQAQLKFAEWDGPRLMTGATQAHTAIGFNVSLLMHQALKGKGCRVFPSDGKIVTAKGNHRFPDVGVDCGTYRPAGYELEAPVVVFEVLSKSTHWIDITRKLDDYKSVASIKHIVFLAQEEARGQCWSRGADWEVAYFEGLAAVVDLPALGVRLALGEAYEGALVLEV